MDNVELDYATYLHLEPLLELQRPKSDPAEHDEMLFITVHQVSELWFNQLLHELDKIGSDLSENHLFRVISSLRRCLSIVRILVDQMYVLETMTPLSFLRFRDRLDSSSGFQSMQFRELEFLLGNKREGILEHYPEGLFGLEAARRRLGEPSLIDHLHSFLGQRGVAIPQEVSDRAVELAHVPNEELQRGIAQLYRSDGQYVVLFDLLVDFDEALQEWRYRHVKLVERTIGNKAGTGGSLGVQFLKDTLFQPVFHDLWAIRHLF